MVNSRCGFALALCLVATGAMAGGDPAKPADAPAPSATEAGKTPEAAQAAAGAGAKPQESAAELAGAAMKAIERVKATEKGKLKNPFTDKPDAIEEGKKLYFSNSCNGCHGGGGGGGMCPPLTNEIFVYGSDDDTMFRLITLGSQDLQKDGYKRKGSEGVVGPMPAYADIITDENHVWKIIAFIRTLFKGEAKRRNW